MEKTKFNFGDLEPEPVKIDEILKPVRPLMRRQNDTHEPRRIMDADIARELAILENGERCEKDVKYALSYLPRNEFIVLHNTIIHGFNALGEQEDQEHDIIVVADGILFDIEAKSITGDGLLISEDGQWKVLKNSGSYAMTSPDAQIERHRFNLESKIKKSDLKIISVLATNNTRLLITDMYKRLPFIVLKTDILAGFIKEERAKITSGTNREMICAEILSGPGISCRHKK